MLRIGWFSTGRGEGSRGLLQFVQQQILGGRLDACIEFVFSNRKRGEAEGSDEYFKLVEKFGLRLKIYHMGFNPLVLSESKVTLM